MCFFTKRAPEKEQTTKRKPRADGIYSSREVFLILDTPKYVHDPAGLYG
jgi:hypothetical protein